MIRVTMYPARTGHADNPFVPILTRALDDIGVSAQHFNPPIAADVDAPFHIHWPERVFWGHISTRIPWVGALNAGAVVRHAEAVRKRGRRVIWTVHNLQPHDQLPDAQRRTWDKLMRSLLPTVTDVVVMSAGASEAVRQQYPALAHARWHVIPHPHYAEYLRARRTTASIRSELAVPDGVPLFVSVGRLRPYKRTPELLRTLRQYDRDFRLLIAGNGKEGHLAEVRAAAGSDPRILFDLRKLSHDNVANYLAAADLAILNFREILNSGSVLSALSLQTPVVAPHLGALRELQSKIGAAWLSTFDPLAGGSGLIGAIDAVLSVCERPVLDLDFMSPSAVAEAYTSIYREEIR